MSNYLSPLLALCCVLAFGILGPAQEHQFLGKNPYYWFDELDSTKPSARRAAAFALGKLGTATVATGGVRPLVARLSDDNEKPEVRDAAAYALGEIGFMLRQYREWETVWKESSPALFGALAQDKDARVRRSAAAAIGGFGTRAATEAGEPLRTALKDEAPGVRQNAAWALGQLGRGTGLESAQGLAEALVDKDALVRRDAAAAVGEIGRLRSDKGQFHANPAVPSLLRLFKSDEDVTIRKSALDALVNAVSPADRSAAAELRPLLHDKDPETVHAAALALGNIGGSDADEAVSILRQDLKKGDTLARIQASGALANVGEGAASAVPELALALDDKESAIRRNAAIALSKIGSKSVDAVPILAKHLHADETSADVRRFAAEALGKMRAEDVVAVLPDLLRALHEDKVYQVRQRCIQCFFNFPELESQHLIEPLTDVLAETNKEHRLVRYDAAYCLAVHLRGRAPAKAVDVLLEMLNDINLAVVDRTGTEVTGSSVEGNKGGAAVAVSLGGDARFVAAKGLGLIGPKANRPDVVRALQSASNATDQRMREMAKAALAVIQGR
jgi:HEAT repeat protein